MNWENTAESRLTTVDEIEAVIGRPMSMIMLKQLSALDDGCRTILARCPIAAFGYRDADGTGRTTFIGGAPGFVRVHSPTRISFRLPEPGSPRGPVSMFFLLPGVGEILRVNGTAAARKGAETTVEIAEAYVHCAQAVLRSRLWQPPAAPESAAPAPLTPPAPPASALEIPSDGPLTRPGVAEFIAVAPFLALSTWDSTGGSDTSPRGDREAVARILDDRTLVIPDRRGNKRADTLRNLVQDDRLSFAALVPGRSGVLHVRGRGAITDDPALLATMALRGIPPHAALLIDVEHAEVTGNDPVARSRMWTPGTHLDRGTAPDLMALASAHLAANAAKTRGGPPAFLLKAIGAIPGMTRLMRVVMNRAYRSGLRKEGYDEVTTGTVPAAADRTEQRARDVRIVEVRPETPSAVTFVLADAGDRPFDFRPGQFFTLITDIDGRPVRRAYSASSAPGSARLEVTVKQVDGGRFSTHAHRTLRPGDRLTLLGPSGTFHAEDQPPPQTVLIAAGSGVTPMMSMIRAQGEGRIALLYSSRSPEETIFATDLTRLAEARPDRLSVTHVTTSRDGRLDADRVRRWITGLAPAADTHYYVCGPEPLTETVQRVLTELGVPDPLVHHERYTSGPDSDTTTTVPQQMHVHQDGHPLGATIVEPGQTLLDAGLAAGLPMPYSCTVGNCGDCMAQLRTGEITQPEPNCLTPAQKAAGYILTCTACPLSPVTLDIPEP
ncbi:2Fe-2S iron-sulfur cluster-binding protein [Actinoplanes palleronii]|uniref:2Fe-2S iron-sulfur cluster-binding protein n=1 Tax=Actinoplanes palleronii TaxID=113570 RepID=UPI001EF31DBF|nr:2Fe-2S iron-sulfur cluster-binding protein [Actinoplanes palleronii]